MRRSARQRFALTCPHKKQEFEKRAKREIRKFLKYATLRIALCCGVSERTQKQSGLYPGMGRARENAFEPGPAGIKVMIGESV